MINQIINLYGLVNMSILTLMFIKENEGKDPEFLMPKLKSMIQRWVIFLILWYFENILKYCLFFFPLISVWIFLLKFKIITMNSFLHESIYTIFAPYYIQNDPFKYIQHKISTTFIFMLAKINDNESKIYKMMNYE